MPTQKHKKPPAQPKYDVGDILRIDFGVKDNSGCERIYYAIITRVDKKNYHYNYLDNWEDEVEDIHYIDTHRGITLHA
jgi:hypothetical protein